MPTIVIVGAGPGMGLAIARTFGKQGFNVALVARNSDNLAALTEQLQADGITAAGFTADVLDHDSLRAALSAASEHFGSIDVLEYSPGGPEPKFLTPSALEIDDVDLQMNYLLYGAIVATKAVLPEMIERGSGTLLFTTGAGSIDPAPFLGDINAAGGALRNWTLNLHKELEPLGIQAAHVAIGAWIGDRAPAGTPAASADEISPAYWELFEDRARSEIHFVGQVA